MVANDLCIKAKKWCGSVKQSSFQWFGVFRATRHFYTSNPGFAVTIFFHYNRYTTVKLLSLKRQKIGMIHINCLQPKHMATYDVGARKPSQVTFLLSTQNIRGL